MDSALIMSQVYSANLMSRAVSVFMYLFNRADRKHMWCFPGIRTIAKDLKMSEPTVKRALRDLVTAGFVKKETRWRANGGQSSNLYILTAVEKTVESGLEHVETSPAVENSVESNVEKINDDKADKAAQPDNCSAEKSDQPAVQQKPDEVTVNSAENSQTEASDEVPCRKGTDETTAKTALLYPHMDTPAPKKALNFIFQPVPKLFSSLRRKLPAFYGFVTPAPGHKFTPNVNLSFYHLLKDKFTSRKRNQ